MQEPPRRDVIGGKEKIVVWSAGLEELRRDDHPSACRRGCRALGMSDARI
jgi:hypothetical protein